MGLREYWKKRDFSATPEPRGEEKKPRTEDLSFVIQKHAASHLHYDIRLELGGVLKSWSVPKGPSLDPTVKRLAMHTEDHPIDYGDFEGIIPKGQYGGGTVLLWDKGRWIPQGDPFKGYRSGKLKFRLEGEKLRGGFTLVKTRGHDDRDDERGWLLIKEDDGEARRSDELSIVEARPESVATGRSMEEIASAQDRVWQSNRAEGKKQPAGRGAKRATTKAKANDVASAAARVKGARPGSLPKKVRPELPKSAREPPSGEGWLHEIQYDGVPVLARVEDGSARLLDERGKDVTGRFPLIAADVEALGAKDALLDGEVTVLLPDGTTSPPPRAGARAPKDGEVVYFAFDLLHLDGHDLTEAPLLARKATLEQLLGAARAAKGPIRYSGHIAGSGQEVFQNGCKLSLKGIVSKRSDGPYEQGRSEGWVRAACRKQRAEKRSAAPASKRAAAPARKRAAALASKRATPARRRTAAPKRKQAA